MAGSGGTDLVTYGARPAGVVVTMDGVFDDGEAGESDNVGADIETISNVIRELCKAHVVMNLVAIRQPEADLPPCAIAISAGRTVLAPFDRLIDDVSAELARLEKRKAKTQQELAKSAAKLANASFVANAPERPAMKKTGMMATTSMNVA